MRRWRTQEGRRRGVFVEEEEEERREREADPRPPPPPAPPPRARAPSCGGRPEDPEETT